MDLSLKSRIICLFLIVCSKEGLAQQFPPRFDQIPLVIQFPENTAVNTSLITVKAQGNNGPITISGYNKYTNDRVYVVPKFPCVSSTNCVATATLYLKTEMDRETESAWSLNIVATDDQHTNLKTVATILIFITDVNDEDPAFDSKLYQITLPEDTTKTAVLNVSASDSDNGVGGLVNYTLKGTGQSPGLYDHAFAINPSSGVVTLKKKLDYSKLSFYQYLIIATDGGGRTGNASLIIKVKDIQNKPPYFTGLPYNIAVDENTAIGTVLGLHIRADDGDIGDPHDVEYSFQSGECINLFEIDNKSGNVTINNTIDRDEGVVLHENGVCTLTLMAKEKLRGNEAADIKDITSNTTVVITINDQDDNSPMFGQRSYNASVDENMMKVPLTIIGTAINVTDKDQGDNSLLVIEVQYVNGTVVTNLKPVPADIQGSGYISLYLQIPFDHEEVQHVDYKVIAREKHNNSIYDHVQIHVEIIDRNDNVPQFLNDSFIVWIYENTPAEQTVLMEKATDKDSGDFGKIEYSLRGGGSKFAVDNTTGVIRTQRHALLDRETRDEYVLTLMARDGGGNLQTVEVTVKLKDVNDNPPIFSQSSYIGFIKENSSTFDQPVTVSAFDRDQKNTNNSRVEFLFDSSLDGIEENFTISLNQSDMSYSGIISLKTPLDYETLDPSINGKIELNVQAVDFGNPSLNTTCVVTIIVQDINDNTPYFNASTYSASILENATTDTNVTTVYAHDDDGTPVNKEINFYIDKGGNDHFRINGKSGVITVDKNAKFDRESVPLYNLTILATDRGTPARTGTTTVIVIIDDVNDSPPTFTESNFKKAVYENVANDFFVSNCSAEDLDENSYLKYKIVGVEAEAGVKNVNETVKNYFEINTNTGIVTVKSSLDREVADQITLVLTVEDLNAVKCPKCPKQTATASLQVTLLDVNDNPPAFQQGPYHLNITEGKISGPVITVKATDKDLNSDITYMITQNYYDTFKIDSSTGLITRDQTKDIDRETCQTIVIEILANDTVHNGTTEVDMTILDVNDNTPTFQEHTPIVYLLENYGTNKSLRYDNTFIADLNATDRDEGPNAELTYHLIKSDTKFQIDPITGVITACGHFDREATGGNEYTLTITVNDNDIDVNKRRTSTTTLTVHINDTNDNAPSFQQNTYTFTIREDVDPGTHVATVSALDLDLYQVIRYSIDHENSDDKYLFKIEESSGVIETNGSLLDKFGRYNLSVNATDHDRLTGYTSVQIIVTDINNNAPQFQHLNFTYYVYECAVIGSNVTKLVATDADSGANKHISYYFVNQTSMEDRHEDFKLDSSNGIITTVKNMSVEVHPVYNIRVGVRDHGHPMLSSTADITIQVIDINNHPPNFEHDIENATVMENTENVTFKTVKATDLDAGSKLVYSIDKGTLYKYSDHFRIDDTGNVTIIKCLDREKTPTVTLKIKAVDISGQSVTRQCYESVLTQKNSTTMKLHVYIQDQNDHKPQFKNSYLSKGVRRTVNKGVTIFDLKDHVELDPDVGINAIHQFKLNGEFTYSNTTKLEQQIKNLPTIEECPENKPRKPICLTGNGTVLTNIHFEENMNGYIDIPVLVQDAAGNSTAVLRLYIISDYQTAAILLGGNKAFVESIQDALMGNLTQKLGLNFTSDGIRAVETGGADPFKSTYLDFHVVDLRTQRILSAREAIDLFDQHSSVLSQLLKIYRIFDVVPYAETKSKSSEQGIKTTYIMTGVIALLGVIVLLVGFFYCKSISRYQRKLKAATTKSSVDKDTDLKASHPGTNIYARNQNPLLNKEEDFSKVDYDRYDNDDLSVTSCDSNQFKKKEPKRGEEEKGATMDMYHEEINMQGEIDALAMVLQQHRQEKAASHESLVPSETQNGHVQSNDLTASFINEGYELHLETTEV